MPEIIRLYVPVVIEEGLVLSLRLGRTPAGDLARTLTKAGFDHTWRTTFRGKARTLDEAVSAVHAHGEIVEAVLIDMPQTVPGDYIIGAVLDHTRTLLPGAATATLAGRVVIPRGSEVKLIGRRWVTWAHVDVAVTV